MSNDHRFKNTDWALILGASSGFGAATSVALAKAGYSIFGVHFDLRSTLPNAVKVQDDVKAAGQEAVFFNINAAAIHSHDFAALPYRRRRPMWPIESNILPE